MTASSGFRAEGASPRPSVRTVWAASPWSVGRRIFPCTSTHITIRADRSDSYHQAMYSEERTSNSRVRCLAPLGLESLSSPFSRAFAHVGVLRVTDARPTCSLEGNLAGCRVKREHFIRVVEEVLQSLPLEFRKRLHNLAVLVEDQPRPPGWRKTAEKAGAGRTRNLVLGVFQGRPATQRSVFDLPAGPDRIILYKKNIEAVCSTEAEIRHEIRQTVLHELGHYFGLDETRLRDV